ncbi:Zinc finger MIZ domain-containing protein [Lachnellula hyalina]|uniref:Zinc finger MIZ domain-containing protein n=1 Tax=Lachnellula hyalina TaxID=1316788 RepID=A0A8H8RBF6_9HELO|nr:Zinc finger MIZ domain-containing protein [Lachnellula hyalina]TVY31178.1 Zinc finger MIZ domain-containing protein [Lachnellula hyalina]
MRRPPDKDGNAIPSDRDVVSSNATLAVFGAARRKSWMTGASTPVRPTPRTNPSKAAVPQVSFAQKSSEAVLPSPAPSDEPSPILANSSVFNSRSHIENQQQAHVDENQFPSASTTLHSSDDERRPTNEANIETNAPHTAQLQAALSGHAQIRTCEKITTSPGHSLDRERFATDPQRQTHPLVASPAMAQPPRENVPASVPARDRSQIGSGQLPSPNQSSVSSPRTASNIMPPTMMQQAQSYPSPGSAATVTSNPNKRQRTQPPVMPSLKPRVALIHDQITAVGGLDHLNSTLERPRFQLLEDACRSEDSFYVALHQIFCIWDLPDPTQVTSIRDFPNTSTLLLAFKIVGQLIRDNGGLAPHHKKWFATFPTPLPDLMRSSEPYRRTVGNVGVFLGRLASDWALLSSECATRSYPPLVDELVNRLGLLSPILQGVVFTAARRNLGVTDDPIGRRMEDLFKKDRQDHQNLAARYNTARPPTEKEIHERNHKLANEYVLLSKQHMRSRRSLGSAVSSPTTRLPTPVLPSSGYFQPPAGATASVAAGTQAEINLGPRQTSSPNIIGAWQSANQPQHRVGSTSSPNIAALTIAGRSPNLNDHRIPAGTPSPTFFQDPTTQSPIPVQQGFNPALRSNATSSQYNHNLAGYGPSTTNGAVYQTPYQAQHQAQYQSANPSTQQPPVSTQQFHLAQRQQQMQLSTQLPPWQVQTPQQRQQLQQQAVMLQQHQQQAVMQQSHSNQQMQHALNLNRAAQIRSGSGSGISPRQRAHSRNNSISSNGRQTPGINTSSVPSPLSIAEPALNATHVKQLHLLNRPFIPTLDMVPVPQPVNPDVTALHQAHLRSPKLVVSDVFPDSQNDKSQRYYQTMKGFAFGPVKIQKDIALMEFYFTVRADDLALIPRDRPAGAGKVSTRELTSGALQYRFRCIQTKPEVTACLPPDWVVSDTVWPDSIFALFNSEHLEIRRKLLHGKDLPIDLTQSVLAAGANFTNKIKISLPKSRQRALKDQGYFIAVEVIETIRHQEIMEMCLQHQRISANYTLEAIKKSLAPIGDEDDDFAIVASDLTLSLADPFTARIFDIPVRGNKCLHRECFDLETFLLTRNSKPKRPQQPCMVDVWKCPLCGTDARPYSLRVDNFLVSVRQELAKQDNLDVKAILISPDGTWRAKLEPKVLKRKAPYDDDSSDDEQPRQRSARETSKKKAAEVIELDDD